MSRLRAPAISKASPNPGRGPFIQPLADGCFRIQTEKFAGGIVHISDAPIGIGDDDSFLDGVEDRLEKTFLLREAEEIVLDLLRVDAPQASDQFFEKTGFHLCVIVTVLPKAANAAIFRALLPA